MWWYSVAMRVGGRAVLIGSLLAFVLGFQVFRYAVEVLLGWRSTSPQPNLLVGSLALVGGFVVWVVAGLGGAWVHRRGRQLAATAAGPVGSGPFVLYLRPFDADIALATLGDGVQSMGPWLTYEEQLREAFRTVGPMVAIGRPGEPLSAVGAIRTEAHEQWQRTVLDLLDRAALVIIVLGGTAGVRWEIERAVDRVWPDRLLVLTLGGDGWYSAARSQLGRCFPRGLPPYPVSSARARATPITGAVWFRPDWSPVIVRLDVARAFQTHWFESAAVYELEPVFAAVRARSPAARSALFRRSRATTRGCRAAVGGCLLTMLTFLAVIGVLAYFIDL